MVLIAITADVLGGGKTTLLTYYAFRNFVIHNRQVYSNYPIKFKYEGKSYGQAKLINNPDEIAKLEDGIFCGDELWAWLDSRDSIKKSNRLGSKILLTSRKKNLVIIYTAQALGQMEKRIREVTDFEAEPVLSANQKICVVTVYQLRRGRRVRVTKKFKFYTKEIFNMFDTNYVVNVDEFTK